MKIVTGRMEKDPMGMEKGDLLLVDSNDNIKDGPDHVCIVWKIEDGNVITIDGNVHPRDKVCGSVKTLTRKEEDFSKFHGVCRPPYDGVNDILENKPSKKSVEKRTGYEIEYCHSIPFWGKSKASISNFGTITVSINNASYDASKIKINKKKKTIQITELKGANNTINKTIKNATKGSNGLSFEIRPYYVKDTDSVSIKKIDNDTVKSVKIKINGKAYKSKTNEWKYNSKTKIITFRGKNLTGRYTSS